MIEPPERQRILDEEHLRLLSIGYFVSGGTFAFIAFFPLIYVVMGVLIARMGDAMPRHSAGPSPAMIGWFLAAIGIVVAVGLGAVGALQLWAGQLLRRRRGRTACLAIAGLSCLFIPWGTVLGVFSFLVLQRASVVGVFTPQVVTTAGPPPPPLPSPPANAT
jgi:hypothetical protein